jgi:hypothetical protein
MNLIVGAKANPKAIQFYSPVFLNEERRTKLRKLDDTIVVYVTDSWHHEG